MAYKNEQLINPFSENLPLIGSDHIEKLRRLFLEALDIASFLCKTHLKYYGFMKIFDIIIQIMPTAFIYNTSYWVFYAVNGNCICVCSRYKIACRHVPSKHHWVDMNPMEEKINESFPARFTNPVICSTPVVEIIPQMVNETYSFDVKCTMRIQNDIAENMPYCLPHIYLEECKIFTLGARLELFHEFEPADTATIIFDPHPQVLSFYGSYFTELQQNRIMRVLQITEENIPHTMIHLTPEAPRHTFCVSSCHFKFETPSKKPPREKFGFFNEPFDKHWVLHFKSDGNASDSSDDIANIPFYPYKSVNAFNERVERRNDKKAMIKSFKKLHINK